MSFMPYVPPEQIMKDRSDYAQKGIARGKSVVGIEFASGLLFIAENPSTTLHKISEIYDRIAFAGVGKYTAEMVDQLVARGHDVRVVSPKGWAPPGLGRWSAYRDVVPQDTVEDVLVDYPRKLTLPGARLGHLNADAFLRGYPIAKGTALS